VYQVLYAATILAFVGFVAWFYNKPDWEPAIGIIASIGGLVQLYISNPVRRLKAGERANRKRRTQLTPRSPVDTRNNRRLWAEVSRKCDLTSLLGEQEATMLVTWPGVQLQAITARYDSSNTRYPRYDSAMPQTAQDVFDAWQRENPQVFQRLSQEPWGLQVRLERVEFDHSQYT
jgi:hypothetical protein